jgi:hypothetical protein
VAHEEEESQVPTANAPTVVVVTGAVAGKVDKATDGQDSEADGEADVTPAQS